MARRGRAQVLPGRAAVAAGDESGSLQAEVRRSATLLVASVLAGLVVGALVPGSGSVRHLAIPALAIQIFLTLGSLPRFRGGATVRGSLQLLAIHHLLATLPLLVCAFVYGVGSPLGFGLLAMAVAPPATMVPIYADLLGLSVPLLVSYSVLAYVVAIVATPLILLPTVGETIAPGVLVTVLLGGLLLPVAAGRLMTRAVSALPKSSRRNIICLCSFVITLGLGKAAVDGLAGASWLALVSITLFLVIRTAGSSAVAGRLTTLGAPSALAAAFKNLGLAAVTASALSEPKAALPALIAFPIDAAYFLHTAHRHSPPQGGG